MELRHLRYFVAVGEELHFGRAARRLGISQPPLSQQIQALEGELDVRLFDRSNRQVRLTRAGTALLTRARQILSEVASAEQQVRDVHRGQTGIVRIGHTQSVALRLLPRALLAHRQRYPDVALQFTAEDSVVILDRLRTGALDLGIVRLPARSDGLVVKPLGNERMVLAVPTGHALARRARVGWNELRDVPFVHFPRPIAPDLHDHIARFLARRDFRMNVVMESGHFLNLLAYVAAGVGVALLLESSTEVTRSDVRYLSLTPSPRLDMAVIHRADAYVDLVPPVVATLRRCVRRTRP
jgi:DNA-binding transcriptional LysR family regulator